MLAVKLGYVTGSFKNLATRRVAVFKLAWQVVPCCVTQAISLQGLLLVSASLPQQHVCFETKE